jgi:general secretion pathway protein G
MKKLSQILRKKFIKCFKDKQGLTLIEITVVLAIIGILFGVLVGPRIMNAFNQARVKTTGIQIEKIKSALLEYNVENNTYPTTEQGLIALVKQSDLDPVPENFRSGGYLSEKDIKDAWGTPFAYQSPSEGEDEKAYLIISYGADKKEGGSGNNKDLIDGE